MALPALAIKRPVTMLMVFAAILLIGLVSLSHLPVEMMPNTSFGDISIIVRIRGGIPPTEVESLVTRPIEEAVGTVSHLRYILSISKEGESTVVLEFEPGINMDFAALEVREKFSLVKDKLPKEIEKPVIAQYQQADVPVMIVAVTGLNHTPEMLRRVVDEVVKGHLERVEGVANVEVAGGRERKILVEAEQKSLQATATPIGKMLTSLSKNNLNLSTGDIETQEQKYLIRAMGQFKNVSDIENLGLLTTPQDSLIRLKQMSVVKDSFLESTSLARMNERPVVSIYIQKNSTANTVIVSEAIGRELKKLKETLGKDILLTVTSNQADSIKEAINTVKKALLHGGILAVLILFIFLRSVRHTVIIALAIPISLLATFSLMFFQNITINIMTLSGLALGIGMLVDNSIVVLENIFRKREKGMENIESAKTGSEEVTLAIAAATLTAIVVFLPLVFVTKEIGMLYSGLAFTITYSLLASLFVSLTLVPLLASRLQDKKPKVVTIKEHSLKRPFFLRVKHKYRQILGSTIRYRYQLLIGAFFLFVVSLFIIPSLGTEFLGVTEQNKFTIFVELPTGAKLEVSDKAVSEVEKIASQIPEIKNVSSRIEGWSSKVYVNLVPLNQRNRGTEEIISDLRPKVKQIEEHYRGAFIYFEEPQEVGTKEVILEVYGFNYDVLKQIAMNLAGRLSSIPGLTDTKIRMREGRPEIRIMVDKQKAALFGLTVEDIANTVHAQMRGMRGTYFHTQAKEVETVVRLDPKDRDTVAKLHKLTLNAKDGQLVYLDQIADFKTDFGPSEIWRRDKSRMVQVSANKGRIPLGKVVEQIKQVMKDFKFPKDYYYRFGGNYWQMVENQKQLTFALWLTIALVFMVMACLFESYFQPLIIMISVPLAAIGVVSALSITHKSVNIGVLIGAMMLGGLAINSAIILVDYINRLKHLGYSTHKAILLASQDRLRPILMTTFTTIFGLIPMALDRSESSNLWSPLAITVIGGLISSHLLTLFIIPGVYQIFDDMKGVRRK